MARPNKIWYRSDRASWYVEIHGRQVKLSPDKAEASRRFHELMAVRHANPAPDGGDPTVVSIIEAFLDHDRHRSAGRTYAERAKRLQLFAEAHGFRRVADCKPFHLTSWLDSRTTWSDWTKATAVKYVQRPFNWAARQGLIAKNPFIGVSHSPGLPRRPMTDGEFAALNAAADHRLREVLTFMRRTGARPCEVRALRWEHLRRREDGTGVAVLLEHKTARTRRDRRPRVIVLDRETVHLVEAVRARSDHPEFVFVSRRRQPWHRVSLAQKLRRLRAKVGLPNDVVLYGLRHQFGTRAVVNGVDIRTLAELMGHTSVRTTEYYTHLAGQQAHLVAAMRRVNDPGPGDGSGDQDSAPPLPLDPSPAA